MKETSIWHWLLKAANAIVNTFVVVTLSLCIIYSLYALWDNNRIYTAAKDVQSELLSYKPAKASEKGPTFQELLAVNPDVCAWVSLDNTNIDYPVLQGETNLTYINTDVYGEFSLAGSIYLDSRNAPDFSQPYSLLYDHHMERSGMFGDLDFFQEKGFFEENSSGSLLIPNQSYELEVFACLIVKASEDYIFEPGRWRDGVDGLLDFVQKNAIHIRKETLKRLRSSKTPQILAFSTCSSEFTDARTIVLAAMDSSEEKEKEAHHD